MLQCIKYMFYDDDKDVDNNNNNNTHRGMHCRCRTFILTLGEIFL